MRAPHVRLSLKTDDLAAARAKRDALEIADDAYWAELLSGDAKDAARARYAAAVKRAEALGFVYRSSADIARNESLEEIVKRVMSIMDPRTPRAVEDAALGKLEQPTVTVSDAFKVYCSEIMPHELVGKSERQRKDWRKVKQRAVNNFVELCGDKAIGDISRADALKLYSHWMARIAPKDGKKPTHSPSSGNRDIGNMRSLFRSYFAHIGDRDRKNPFDGLNFAEAKRSRPPFPTEWIAAKMLQGDALSTLNPEARAIVLVMIETGARPSEICNLDESVIDVTGAVPHIRIQPRTDPEDPREIKTASSVRAIPLVGVALAALKAHPKGFPRYRNNEATLSNTLNKSFKVRGLLPTEEHSVYSLRHSFEDRMKIGGIDEELRRLVMGHTIDRPRYGAGGSLEWRRDELSKIALPFDPAVV